MNKEAMTLALEDYLSREMPAGTVIGDPKWWAGKIANVLAKQEQGEPVAWPTLTADEREALERFNETCEDGQEYDVSKSMMKHLAEVGVVYSAGFGRYGFTEFGRAALNHPQPSPKQEQGDPVGEWNKKLISEAANCLEDLSPNQTPETSSARQIAADLKMMLSKLQPAQKPLTDKQREEIAKGWRGRNWTVGDIIDAIEAAHGIKGDA